MCRSSLPLRISSPAAIAERWAENIAYRGAAQCFKQLGGAQGAIPPLLRKVEFVNEASSRGNLQAPRAADHEQA